MAPCRGTARRPSAGRPISRRCLEVRSAPFAQGQGWIEVGCPGSWFLVRPVGHIAPRGFCVPGGEAGAG